MELWYGDITRKLTYFRAQNTGGSWNILCNYRFTWFHHHKSARYVIFNIILRVDFKMTQNISALNQTTPVICIYGKVYLTTLTLSWNGRTVTFTFLKGKYFGSLMTNICEWKAELPHSQLHFGWAALVLQSIQLKLPQLSHQQLQDSLQPLNSPCFQHFRLSSWFICYPIYFCIIGHS